MINYNGLFLAGHDSFFLKMLHDVTTGSRFNESKNFIQHGKTSVYEHSCNVALMSYKAAIFFDIAVDTASLLRGALLHDYFLYDWHMKNIAPKWHGIKHPAIAHENAMQDFSLTEIESDIIRHHMFPLTPIPPRSIEALLVCITDKICAVLEMFNLL